jgi:acylphosphatase
VTGPAAAGQARLTAWVHGYVQGVGFRWWTRSAARDLGLVGTVKNLPDGRVEVVAEGPEPACRRLLDALRGPGTPGRVRKVVDQWGVPQGRFTSFVER